MSDLPAGLRRYRAAVLDVVDSTRRAPRRDAYWERPAPPPTRAQQQQAYNQQRQRGALQRDLAPREAYAPGINPQTGLTQGQEALLMHLEPTGAPAAVRAYRSAEEGRPLAETAGHAGFAALNVAGMRGTTGPVLRNTAPMRGALRPPVTQAARMPEPPMVQPPRPAPRASIDEIRAAFPEFDEGAILARAPVSVRSVDDVRRDSLDPFADDPWEIGENISIEEVRAAMLAGRREARSFSHEAGGDGWTREQHIDRVATLARDGWDEPILILPYGQIDDGLHRFAAAIARGDTTIRVRQPPLSQAAQRELAADPRQLEAEYRARPPSSGAEQMPRGTQAASPPFGDYAPAREVAGGDMRRFSERVSAQLDQGRYIETEIPYSELTATQRNVRPDLELASEPNQNTATPVVVRMGGRNYVYDGHYRLATRAARDGATTARVRLVDLDNPARAAPDGGARVGTEAPTASSGPPKPQQSKRTPRPRPKSRVFL